MSLQIYCVKCKAKTESDGVSQVILKNGRDAATAVCTVCGTNKFRMGKIPVET